MGILFSIIHFPNFILIKYVICWLLQKREKNVHDNEL